jgi:hypothetical protein
MPREFAGQTEVHEYAEHLPAHGSTRAPYKVAASVSPEQYEIVNVRTSRGLSRPIVLKIHTERGAIVAPNGAAASAGCSPEAGSLPRVKAAPAERPSSEGWIEHHRVRSALLSEVVSANRASRVQWRSLTDPEHRITECKVWRRRSAKTKCWRTEESLR